MLNFIIDVDGCMTDGKFIYSKEGKMFKTFGPHDSDGLEMIREDKVKILFISADKRGFEISKKRIEDIGFKIQLVTEAERYEFIKINFGFDNTIYMGDGIYDAPILKKCLFGIAPKNARKEAKDSANFITESEGGKGAVCDACIEIKRRFLE